ncbi:MAG TPA: hypothetical protein VFL10_06690 [Ornithinibacter sp.]|nr:hypothetical protein [Ornithinibacter sp.]
MLGMEAPAPFDPSVLRLYADLRRAGLDPQRAGGWQRVRRGVWMPVVVWQDLTPEQRHAALVHATALVCDGEGRPRHVFAAESAAAVWGLPRVEAWPTTVRTLATSGRPRGSSGVRPLVGAEVEPVAFKGVLVTPVARTLADLACRGSLPSAVAAADHAVRHGLCSFAELRAEADAVPHRVRGRPAARLVAELADSDSMSVGESLSRVQMFRLGVPRPRLQVPHHDDQGLIGVVDFEWLGVVGEFDGKLKYRVPPGASPEEAAEIVWREKKREDRLRVDSRVARWTWQVALDRDQLGRVLAAQGVRPGPRASWFDLGAPRSA